MFWRAIQDEFARAGASDGWRWPAVVAVLFLTATALGLAWLALGLMAVRRQRLRSRPVLAGELLELVDVLCAELGCRRPLEVRQSDDLATAATIGWRRPTLLLPADWTTWTADQRRAVLAHEIAHARSQDFLALLFGQLGLALHFYHPLLHWLIRRLRLEQELAADAAAAGVSGGQRQYLTAIAELVLHRQDRAIPWPARTFLPTQTTFLRRMTPLEAARAFFEACAKENWAEAGKFCQPLTDDMKRYLGGLEVVQLGKPFKPQLYGGWMVPYTIKFKDGNTKSWNLAVRNDNPAKRYVVDGGL